MLNHFTFNGHSTAEYGLLVTALNPYSAPSRRIEKVEIPYRNGDLVIDSGVYNNIIVSYEVSVINNTKDNFEALRNWLLTSQGYHQLSDTINTDSFRVGCYYQSVDATLTALYKYGKAVISFDCFPQRYLTTNTPINTTATADTTTDTTMSLSTVPTPLNISLNGNTTQEGSSGKNKMLFRHYSFSATQHGVTGTWDKDTQSFTLSGTNTSTSAYGLLSSDTGGGCIFPNLTAGETYTLTTYGKPTGAYLQINYLNTSSQARALCSVNQSNAPNTFTVPSDYASLYMVFVGIYGTATTVNGTFKVQLEKGSTSTAFEPFLSPYTPQTIHSVSGSNEVKIARKNIFTFPTWQTVSTAPLYNGYRKVKLLLPPNTTYYLNTTFKNGYSPVGLNMYVLVGDYLNTVYKSIAHSAYGAQNGTVTTNADGELYISVYNATQTKYEELIENSQVQLEKGATATAYEPYTVQSYPIDFPVENLIPKATTSTLYGVTFTVAEDGTITTSGTSTAIIYYPVVTTLSLPSDTYTLSGSPKDANDTTLFMYTTPGYHSDYGNTRTFTDSVEKVYIYVASGQNMDGKVFKPQLEKGKKANAYTPYGTTPIELNKIGTRQDYIYKNGGKWYLYKEFNKVDLGTLTWEKQVSSSIDVGYYFQTQQVTLVPSTTRWLCTSYPNTGYTGLSNIVANLGRGVDKIGFSAGGTLFYIIDSGYTEATAFKSSVSGKYLIYSTNAPTNTEITDTTLINQLNNIEKAYSYNGTTNILQVSNDNGFMLSVVSLHSNDVSSAYKGEPIITVNSTGLIYFNGCVIKVNQAPMTINSQTMQAYNGTVNLNNYIEANDFPMIEAGNNVIGSEMPLSIVPNYWKL